MLLRIIFRNFLSFDSEMQFDMFPNIKRTQLSNHIYTQFHEVPLLKQAAIYGANGAGKSNIVKAIEFLRTFALEKNFLRNIEIEKFRYLLKDVNNNEPIFLAIEFWSQGRFFFYEIAITEKEIRKEALYESFPKAEKLELIYERKGCDVIFKDKMDSTIMTATQKMLQKNPLASLLALNGEFPIISDARCKNAAKWFKGHLTVIGIHSFVPTLIELLRNNKQMMEFARNLVHKLSLGINDMNLHKSDFDNWAKTHMNLARTIPDNMDNLDSLCLATNTTPVFSINIEDGVRKVYQLIFDNIGKNGYIGKLDVSMQSDGTMRALTLLPALYFACKQGHTVVVDEINCCLSPSMVKGIVEFFAKSNDTNGQLIFTTHDNQLLDEKNILRSDEIWFVDKREGSSVLYSHNDFKEHHTISLFRGYNEGRFGAIRFINLLTEDE